MLETLDIRTVEAIPGRAYEWVTAQAVYAVDPDDKHNTSIVDLELAPRSPDGLVRFRGDVGILRPLDGGNHRALLSVSNRGSVNIPFGYDLGLQGLNQPPVIDDESLLEQGWSIVWAGWQWDVDRSSGAAGLEAPIATVEPGLMRSEFHINAPASKLRLADQTPVATFAAYPAAFLDDEQAVLTVRTSQMGPRREVPREQWRFTSHETFSVDGGFQQFHRYELFYRSKHAPVVGTGLLAVRDLGAYLRTTYEHVFAFGISQTGRFLRHYLHLGLNLDEAGSQVFDGVFINIASARRGEFNRRYAQPSLLAPLMPEYGPPYDTTSLLARQRAAGGVPKIMTVNSAAEYWRGDGALEHQDATTGDDLPEDGDARVHLVSGTDHLGSAIELKRYMPIANPPHALDPNPVLRALFIQLASWVCEGAEPSASTVPRRADGTAVQREQVLARFPQATTPDPNLLPYTPAIDPDAATWPLRTGAPRVALVSAVDQHGNEVAGIRLPEVATGAAAYTGWNTRAHTDGLPEVMADLVGSKLPAQVPAKLTESDVREAALELVRRRFLLERDMESVVARALTEIG
ncbi:alpha/beta hydrolase domain-containing protein [Streptomyces sp. NPDC055037]